MVASCIQIFCSFFSLVSSLPGNSLFMLCGNERGRGNVSQLLGCREMCFWNSEFQGSPVKEDDSHFPRKKKDGTLQFGRLDNCMPPMRFFYLSCAE